MTHDGYIGFSDAEHAALAESADAVTAAQAQVHAAHARLTRALAAADAIAAAHAAASSSRIREHDMARRTVAAELAGRLQLSDRAVQRRMDAATELTHDYPATLSALETGRLTLGHVRALVDAGRILPAEHRAAFEAAALPRCEADTPGRVRRGLELLAERMHPRSLTERHQEARETRGITLTPLGDGMTHLGIDVPTVIADGTYDRVTRMARALVDLRTAAAARLRASRAEGLPDDAADALLTSDTRTIDQLRADIAADLLLTGNPGLDAPRPDDGPGTLGAIRAHVQVVVPVLSLLGTDDEATDLAGRSPIDADTARRLAGGSCTGWDRILTHPVSGQILASDRRLAPPALRRQIHARDQHCRFPGCISPAIRCEIDHVVDWAQGGATAPDNLQCLCQRHHSMKQFTAWKVKQLDGGVIEWTSPLGRVYTEDPPTLGVHFAPDGPAPWDEWAPDPPNPAAGESSA